MKIIGIDTVRGDKRNEKGFNDFFLNFLNFIEIFLKKFLNFQNFWLIHLSLYYQFKFSHWRDFPPGNNTFYSLSHGIFLTSMIINTGTKGSSSKKIHFEIYYSSPFITLYEFVKINSTCPMTMTNVFGNLKKIFVNIELWAAEVMFNSFFYACCFYT